MNIEEIRENQLQKAEENLNDKIKKLENSAQIINYKRKSRAYPLSSNPQKKKKLLKNMIF